MAGRPRIIDRDRLIDLAEAIIVEEGAAALSFDRLARTSGATKGGIQNIFRTKENLIQIVCERWADEYEAAIAERVEGSSKPRDRVRAHILETGAIDPTSHRRAAALLLASISHPVGREGIRRWYDGWLGGLRISSEADGAARLAFLAVEGLFMIRFFGFRQMSEEEWEASIAGILAMLPSDGAKDA